MDMMINFLQESTYLMTGILIFLENIFPPIPSEVILISSAIVSVKLKLSLVILLFSATLGSVLGALVLYYVGTLFNEERLLAFNQKVKFLGFKDKDIQSTFKYFSLHGGKLVFFGRMIPIVRSLISIPAGSTKMKLGIFIIYTSVGSLIWNTCLIVVGAFFAQYASIVTELIATSTNIIIILFIGLIVILIVNNYRRSK